MSVLFCYNRNDPAGVNIARNLMDRLEKDGILRSETEYAAGSGIYRLGEHYIKELDRPHIYLNHMDRELPSDLDIEGIVFLSRHRSVSGRRTLTVHPMGVYLEAVEEYGGESHTLTPAMPDHMTALLKAMISHSGMAPDFSVSFEVTHHGPALETPALNFEIGSVEEHWVDENAGRVQGEVLRDVYFSGHQMTNTGQAVVGFGGGHYAPRYTDIASRFDVPVGHIVPTYTVEAALKSGYPLEDLVRMAIDATPGAAMAYYDRKSLKKLYRPIKEIAESLGMESVRSKDLESL